MYDSTSFIYVYIYICACARARARVCVCVCVCVCGVCTHNQEGSGKGIRVTEGKLWYHVLQSYTDKSPAAINVLAVLVRVGNQLSRSLSQFMVEYVETRQISFNRHFLSHLKLFSTSRKKMFHYLVKFV